MKIITLTSDFGLNDHYVASLKGYLYSHLEDIRIVDISHSVKAFDTAEAAYLLSSCYKDFPKGTIHIIGVDSEPVINFGGTDGVFPSILEFEEQLFISNDNGFFGSFLNERNPDKIYQIDNVLSNKKLYEFPTKNIFCATAIELVKGTPIEELASPAEGYKRAFSMNAISEKNLIKGHIVHIDSYGNAITNVHQELFNQVGSDNPFRILLKRVNRDRQSTRIDNQYMIDRISISYNEVPQGEKVAIFNKNGFLEIAINRAATSGTGGADKLFGFHKGDIIRISFEPPGSHENLQTLF